jgi:hypothetical protein
MINGDYILVIAPQDYPGKKYRERYCYEHHLVYWENTGNTIPNGYSIHHIDENKHNNIFSNLQLVSNSQHGKIHAKIVKPLNLNCSNCKKEFYIKRHLYKHRIKKGQKEFFCSKKCIGLYGYNRKFS